MDAPRVLDAIAGVDGVDVGGGEWMRGRLYLFSIALDRKYI